MQACVGEDVRPSLGSAPTDAGGWDTSSGGPATSDDASTTGDGSGSNDAESEAGADAGADAVAPPPPSCAGLGATCGTESPPRDCCQSLPIDGGAFHRAYDGVVGDPFNSTAYPAEIASFKLDTFEVTVARFRNFLEGYPGNLPKEGAGRNPNDPSDPGWRAAWSSDRARIPPTAADTVSVAGYCQTYRTYTDAPGANEYKPINCINWYVAYAFCIWDGGRLPTNAELNYAAAGGSLQRAYPWSDPSTSTAITTTHAVWGTWQLANVGSYPAGVGAFGQFDLSGNVAELTSDRGRAVQYPIPCVNCANHDDGTAVDTQVSVRGGSAMSVEKLYLRNGSSVAQPANSAMHDSGVRCAR